MDSIVTSTGVGPQVAELVMQSEFGRALTFHFGLGAAVGVLVMFAGESYSLEERLNLRNWDEFRPAKRLLFARDDAGSESGGP